MINFVFFGFSSVFVVWIKFQSRALIRSLISNQHTKCNQQTFPRFSSFHSNIHSSQSLLLIRLRDESNFSAFFPILQLYEYFLFQNYPKKALNFESSARIYAKNFSISREKKLNCELFQKPSCFNHDRASTKCTSEEKNRAA